MPKRAALLFDRLMVALQKVVDNQNKGELDGSRPFARSPHLSIENSQIIPSTDEQTMKVSLPVHWCKIIYSKFDQLLFFCTDGSSATRSSERACLLALLFQRCDMLQEKVIISQRNQPSKSDYSHAFPG